MPLTTPRRAIAGAVASLLVVALATGCGSNDEDASSDTTAAPGQLVSTQEPQEKPDEAPSTTEADVTTTTAADATAPTAPAPVAPGEATVDGQATVTDTLEADVGAEHIVVIPDGTAATVTVTPTDNIDLVVTAGSEEFDSGLSGEPEVLEGDGPLEQIIVITSFYGEAGGYTITVSTI